MAMDLRERSITINRQPWGPATDRYAGIFSLTGQPIASTSLKARALTWQGPIRVP